VRQDGTIGNQTGGIVVNHETTGSYEILFPTDISQCAALAENALAPTELPHTTLQTGPAIPTHFASGGTITFPGVGNVDSGRTARVQTESSAAGLPAADGPFTIVVFC
jgi:hypothetical protein